MNRIYYIMVALLFCAASINAQVRIGKNEDPRKGAILDLQFADEGEAENKGIVLPRVMLESLSSFEPLAEDKDAVEGMLVYNIGDAVPKGLYIWSGKWIMLGEASETPDSNLPGAPSNWVTVEEDTPVTGEGTESNPYKNTCPATKVSLTLQEGYTFGEVVPAAATEEENETLHFDHSAYVVVHKGSQSSLVYVEITKDCDILVESVSVTPTSASIEVDKTQQLTATVLPVNATNKAVSWKSSNTAVATVNATSGLVTAKAAGSATITVTTEDGGETATCKVTVTAPVVSVTDVTLNYATLTLHSPEARETLRATVSPGDATNTGVIWSSSEESVATVNNGLVIAQGVGTTIITATAADGSGKEAKCTVTVYATKFNLGVSDGVYVKNYDGDYLPTSKLPSGSDASAVKEHFTLTTASDKMLYFQNADLSTSTMNWNDAKSACEKIGGRLPTLYELAWLHLDQDLRTNYGLRSNRYWSSTEYSSGAAWDWNFSGGTTTSNLKSNTRYVRCVRSN